MIFGSRQGISSYQLFTLKTRQQLFAQQSLSAIVAPCFKHGIVMPRSVNTKHESDVQSHSVQQLGIMKRTMVLMVLVLKASISMSGGVPVNRKTIKVLTLNEIVVVDQRHVGFERWKLGRHRCNAFMLIEWSLLKVTNIFDGWMLVVALPNVQ